MTPARPQLTPGDSSYVDELVGDLTINLQKIREHGKRADSIVRGMLAHSRGGSGQPETVDLNSLVGEAVNLAYHGLRAQDSTFNIALEAEYDQSMPPLQVVAQDLSRVILNIANNGCYAANQKRIQRGDSFRPRLRVTTSHNQDHAEVRIHDNGTGISKSALQKIFNPFFTTKPTGMGTGLGLSLSYQIVVKEHGGTVDAEVDARRIHRIPDCPAPGRRRARSEARAIRALRVSWLMTNPILDNGDQARSRPYRRDPHRRHVEQCKGCERSQAGVILLARPRPARPSPAKPASANTQVEGRGHSGDADIVQADIARTAGPREKMSVRRPRRR